jgi:hypothetical protein
VNLTLESQYILEVRQAIRRDGDMSAGPQDVRGMEREPMSGTRSANRLQGGCGGSGGYADGLTAADDDDYCAYGDYDGEDSVREQEKWQGRNPALPRKTLPKDAVQSSEANPTSQKYWNEME